MNLERKVDQFLDLLHLLDYFPDIDRDLVRLSFL
jgi:hypothetical protein